MKYDKFTLLSYDQALPLALTADSLKGIPIIVYTNGKEQHIYNDKMERLALLSNYRGIDFLKLSTTGNWFVLSGVFLKKEKWGNTVIHDRDKFSVQDILVWDGENVLNMPTNLRRELYLPKIQYSLLNGISNGQ